MRRGGGGGAKKICKCKNSGKIRMESGQKSGGIGFFFLVNNILFAESVNLLDFMYPYSDTGTINLGRAGKKCTAPTPLPLGEVFLAVGIRAWIYDL